MDVKKTENYQNFFVGKNGEVIDGKIQWKDFIQVNIDKHDEAFTLAMNILRQIEFQQFEDKDKKRPISFSLTGALEKEGFNE